MLATIIGFLRYIVWALIALSLVMIADWVLFSHTLFEKLLNGFFARSSFFTATLTLLASLTLLVERGTQLQAFLAKA